MLGNPVKLGDGCATVMDHELPMPLTLGREGGSEATSPKSGYRFGYSRHGHSPVEPFVLFARSANFSVKEKDEASPSELFLAEVSAFILFLCGVWRFFIAPISLPTSHWSLNHESIRGPAELLKDQLCKKLFSQSWL